MKAKRPEKHVFPQRDDIWAKIPEYGLTYRQLLAGMAASGICTTYGDVMILNDEAETIAKQALRVADAIIAQEKGADSE